MWVYFLKVIATALLVVIIAETSKRWTLVGALIASLPLTSVLAMIWLYLDTGDLKKVSAFSAEVLWLVLPSLIFFALFPVLTRWGWSFWPSIMSAALCTSAGYYLYLRWVV